MLQGFNLFTYDLTVFVEDKNFSELFGLMRVHILSRLSLRKTGNLLKVELSRNMQRLWN